MDTTGALIIVCTILAVLVVAGFTVRAIRESRREKALPLYYRLIRLAPANDRDAPKFELQSRLRGRPWESEGIFDHRANAEQHYNALVAQEIRRQGRPGPQDRVLMCSEPEHVEGAEAGRLSTVDEDGVEGA
jgi:hypothetical protein